MTYEGAPAADEVSRLIACELAAPRPVRDVGAFVRSLIAARRRFGITRVGTLTRLDRAGVDVVQAVRPLALSNVASQGKGLTPEAAAASALVEAIETFAGEVIPPERVTSARARDLDGVRTLFAGALVHDFDAGWDMLPLRWIDGHDLLRERTVPVPLALVDTVYTLPSPHPVAFPRTTSGLGGGTTLLGAILQAGLERLERATVATVASSRRQRACAIDPATVATPFASAVLARLRAENLVAGIWLLPAAHGLPVYRCHVMEGEARAPLAPLPGEGSCCDLTHDRALGRALLEAAQARLTAVAGTREDITRREYDSDARALAAWRAHIARPPGAVGPPAEIAAPDTPAAALARLRAAFVTAGASAMIVVPLLSCPDLPLHVVRVVAPPLPDCAAA